MTNLSRYRGPTLDTTSKYPEDSPTLPRLSRLGRRKLTGMPIIFFDNTLALVEFRDRLALGVQELQWNRREAFLGLVLRLRSSSVCERESTPCWLHR